MQQRSSQPTFTIQECGEKYANLTSAVLLIAPLFACQTHRHKFGEHAISHWTEELAGTRSTSRGCEHTTCCKPNEGLPTLGDARASYAMSRGAAGHGRHWHSPDSTVCIQQCLPAVFLQMSYDWELYLKRLVHSASYGGLICGCQPLTLYCILLIMSLHW